jgi:DNA-binding response OmpR family regulator
MGDTRACQLQPAARLDQKADRVWGQMLGVKGYITKPYPPQALLDMVKAIG